MTGDSGARDELACLRVEIETNFIRDERGRLLRERVPEFVPPPFVVIASARQGSEIAVGAHVPDPVADQILERFGDAPGSVPDPSSPPAEAERYLDLVTAACGPVVAGGVPCFVIVEPPDFRRPATVVLSTEDRAQEVLATRPPGRVDERRGPWAAVVADGRMVSVCSTARSHEEGAEAGTWTDPRFRGRGYASAATAAWATLHAGSGRVLFYCTDEANRSSQRVAARLGLHPIGWMWKIVPRGTL